jgi:hypothetical protein
MSELINPPTPEQAGVKRVLKTRTDNRLLLGGYLIFKKTAGSGYFRPLKEPLVSPENRHFRLFPTSQRTAGLRREPSFPVISNPLKETIGFPERTGHLLGGYLTVLKNGGEPWLYIRRGYLIFWRTVALFYFSKLIYPLGIPFSVFFSQFSDVAEVGDHQ